ncbi:hypothetical protein BGZ98_005970 [Dissophora globulifera]|nr:hypothetical protein BGZ98_005970 [Dissophora globulifera]
MNILPHKSWHVYNQKNRNRVRQDEALAEAKEHEIQERNTAADREHRLNVLRARAQKRLSNRLDDQDGSQDQGQDQDQDQDQDQTVTIGPTPEDTKSVVVAKQHINFWADSGQQEPKKRQGNPENEAEQKAKQEKWDRTIAMHLDTGIKGTPTPIS